MGEGAAVILPAEALRDLNGAIGSVLTLTTGPAGSKSALNGGVPFAWGAGHKPCLGRGAAGIDPCKNAGQGVGHLTPCHAGPQRRIVISAQNCHIKAG